MLQHLPAQPLHSSQTLLHSHFLYLLLSSVADGLSLGLLEQAGVGSAEHGGSFWQLFREAKSLVSSSPRAPAATTWPHKLNDSTPPCLVLAYVNNAHFLTLDPCLFFKKYPLQIPGLSSTVALEYSHALNAGRSIPLALLVFSRIVHLWMLCQQAIAFLSFREVAELCLILRFILEQRSGTNVFLCILCVYKWKCTTSIPGEANNPALINHL